VFHLEALAQTSQLYVGIPMKVRTGNGTRTTDYSDDFPVIPPLAPEGWDPGECRRWFARGGGVWQAPSLIAHPNDPVSLPGLIETASRARGLAQKAGAPVFERRPVSTSWGVSQRDQHAGRARLHEHGGTSRTRRTRQPPARFRVELSNMEEGWERPPRVELGLEELGYLVEPAFPGERVVEHSVLGAGLANTNIRFRLGGRETAYVLRLYTRDRTAAAREQALMRYLAASAAPPIPVPPLIYSDLVPARGGHPYSIWGFVEGALLQDLFKTLPAAELVEIADACGRVLAAFAAHRFETSGALGPGLEIASEYGPPSRFVPETIQRALFEGRAGARLGPLLRDALWAAVERTSPLLAALDGHYTLVHADFKRSNLLVNRSDGVWRVAAVLDWEFACAGPPLVDVGLFLRAGDALPDGFREAFRTGYLEAGGELPPDWLRLSRLIDLVSQVTFLDDLRDRPRVFAETTEVVEETLRMLER
jgi:aminoglycoside phosphotransferase (APT) family kinase protein